MRNYLIIWFLMAMLLSAKTIRADFPIRKGRTALIGTYNYFYSNKYFDDNGKIVNYLTRDNYQAHSIGLNVAHGIGRNVDVMLSVPISIINKTESGNKTNNYELADINLGFLFHFPSSDYQQYFTIKVNGIIPAHSNQDSTKPFIGYASKGAAVALNYSFNPFTNGFVIVEAAYIRFFDNQEGPSQYRTILSFNFNHQISVTTGTRNFNTNLAVNKYFSGGTLSVGLSKRITRTITPAVTAFYTLYGKNLGLGVGANFTFIMRLP